MDRKSQTLIAHARYLSYVTRDTVQREQINYVTSTNKS